MTIRFMPLVNQIRLRLENEIEHIDNDSKSEDESVDRVQEYFNTLKENNYENYKNIIGLMAADHYKNIISMGEDMQDDERECKEFYEELANLDELVLIVDEDPEMLMMLFYEMSEFSSYDYFEKRTIYFDMKDKLDVLYKLSFYSYLDYLYYCQKYDLEILKTIYNEQVELALNSDDATDVLITTIEHLFLSDTDNYKQLITDLLYNYYLIGKDKLSHDKELTNRKTLECVMEILENNDIIDILSRLRDHEFLSKILKVYFEEQNTKYTLNSSDEKENKTLQKILRIKVIGEGNI